MFVLFPLIKIYRDDNANIRAMILVAQLRHPVLPGKYTPLPVSRVEPTTVWRIMNRAPPPPDSQDREAIALLTSERWVPSALGEG